MIDERFVYLVFVIKLINWIIYSRATLRGEAKPNRVSLILWSLATYIAFAAQVSEGVGLPSLLTLSAGMGPTIILIVSFYSKKAYWKLKRSDYVFGGLSLIGLLLWQITGEGTLAIIFALTGDIFATIPTIAKSYTHPNSEYRLSWAISAIAALITLMTIDDWVFEEYSFAVYLFVTNVIIYSLIRFEPRKRWGLGSSDETSISV